MKYIASDNQEQINMRVFLRVYPIFFLLLMFIAGPVFGQELEPEYVEAKVLQGTPFELEVNTWGPAQVIEWENYGSQKPELEEITLNREYKFVYDTDPDFVGLSRFVIERREILNGAFNIYTEVVVKVVPSLLEAVHDVGFIESTSSEVMIDVTANDIPGHGETSLLSVDLVSNGTAEIIGNQVRFTKAVGFEGQTSFNYTVQDDSGYKSSGAVTINAQGATPLAGSTLRFMTDPMTPVMILVDDATYTLDEGSGLVLGNVSNQMGHYLIYKPKIASKGIETFDLTNSAGDRVSVVIEILDDNYSGLLVRDDTYYTSVGTTITFDPRENDYSTDGVLIDFSDELSSSDGVHFSYTPPAGFSGVKTFYYTILDGVKEMEGSIELYVGNYLPQLANYSFETYENTPFVIDYKAPILDYHWNLTNGPSDGFVTFAGSSPGDYGCNIATGDHLAIYIPKDGFSGNDQFTLEYCVSNGTCKEVAVDIVVHPNDGGCRCVGSDCVWAGDADNDGKVSVKDILAIGYNYGETGASRVLPSGDWGSNHANDWDFDQEDLDLNNKFADSDGNGIVNSDDAVVLDHNLQLYHNIGAEEVLAQKNVPLIFVPTTPGPYLTGDLITLEVYVGSGDIPVEDLRGLVFSAGFPPDKVDPESIKFTPDSDWLGSDSPLLTATDLNDGILEVGMSRTINTGVFGDGRIGTTKLIILSDVDGARPGDKELPFDISFNQARMSNSVGKSFKIQAKRLQLKIAIDGKADINDNAEVIAFPNPSEDVISFYANNNDELIDVQIYNMMGGLVLQSLDINNRSIELSHQLPQGVYSAVVKTQKGVAVEKVQVIDQR